MKIKEICSICSIDQYNNKGLTLDVDHINGDNTNNRIENLRFLCPNCHSQTSTFRKKNYTKKNKQKKEDYLLAIKNSYSIFEALNKLNLTPKGDNYKTIKK